MEEKSIAIGRGVRLLREKINLTQQQIGEYLGVSQSAVARFETGERPISISHLEKLAMLTDGDIKEFSKENPVFRIPQFALRSKDASVGDLETIAIINKIANNCRQMEILLSLGDEE